MGGRSANYGGGDELMCHCQRTKPSPRAQTRVDLFFLFCQLPPPSFLGQEGEAKTGAVMNMRAFGRNETEVELECIISTNVESHLERLFVCVLTGIIYQHVKIF